MPNKPSRIGFVLLVIFVLAAAAAAAAWFGLRPVATVATIQQGNAANVVPASVVVEAGLVSQILSEIEGKLIESKLAPGVEVKENDKIAELDKTDVELEIEAATSELEAAKKTIDAADAIAVLQEATAQAEFDEATRQHKNGIVTQVEMDKRDREFQIAKKKRESDAAENARRLAALNNTLKTAERKKAKMTIRAPFDGTLNEVFVNRNDHVPSKQPLATIIAKNRLVRAKISEENIAGVEIGQKAVVNFLGYPEQKFDAVVTKKLPSAEVGSQRYSVYLDVQIPPEKLVPNLTGDAGIYLDEHRGVTLVPSRAMFDGYVYVVENGRVRQQKLELGYKDFNAAEVKSGVKPGDLVITEELDKFRDGQRVRVVPAK